jgi:UDP:flavonoid glycosyltransferase YjiC (YdhE family)
LTLSHGGHGTLSASLAAAVPLIVLPNTAADQPFLAERVEELGAGLALPGDASADAIRVAARRVLGASSFRDQAAALAGDIARSAGASGAADVLDDVASGRWR